MEEEEEEDETNGIDSSQLNNKQSEPEQISSVEIPQYHSTQERMSTQYVKEETIAEQYESIVEEENSAYLVEEAPKLDEVPAAN